MKIQPSTKWTNESTCRTSPVCGYYECHAELVKTIQWRTSAIHHIHWPPNAVNAQWHSSLQSSPNQLSCWDHTHLQSLPEQVSFPKNLPEFVFHWALDDTALTSALDQSSNSSQLYCWVLPSSQLGPPTPPYQTAEVGIHFHWYVHFTLFIENQKHWNLLPSAIFPNLYHHKRNILSIRRYN